MTEQHTDWEAIFKSVAQEDPAKLVSSKDNPKLRPAERQAVLARLPGPLLQFRISGDYILNSMATTVLTLCETIGEDTVVVGVIKKGLSMLTEVVGRRPKLRSWSLMSDGSLGLEDIKGRPVVVVDDSIHTGKTLHRVSSVLQRAGASRIAWVTSLSTNRGLEGRPDSCDLILSALSVGDEEFDGAFHRLVVPALDLCKKGAIADRPCRDFVVRSAPEKSEGEIFADILRALRDAPSVSKVVLTSNLSGSSPCFRATVSLSPSTASEARAQLRSATAPNVDSTLNKIRIFFQPGVDPEVRIHGMVHPDESASTSTPLGRSKLDEEMDRTSEWLIEHIYHDLDLALTVTGHMLVVQSSIAHANGEGT